jgi:CRP/FNR family cyclic AMP-dependent transcriptional regulator
MKELIALKRVPLFSTLTLEQLASVDRLMVTRHYLKGEPIFKKGDAGAELFVVVEGEIRVHLDGAGREVTLARHGDGSVVGEMAVFDEQPRSAGAQASVDTTVRVLRRDRLHAIVHEHPEVLLEFIKNLSQRLREMDEKLETAAPTG